MKNIKRIALQLSLKLIIGVGIFLIMDRIFNPEKPLIHEGIYSGFVGYSIFIIGETIWKTNRKIKKSYK